MALPRLGMIWCKQQQQDSLILLGAPSSSNRIGNVDFGRREYFIAVLHAEDTSDTIRLSPTVPLCSNAAVNGKKAQRLSRKRQK